MAAQIAASANCASSTTKQAQQLTNLAPAGHRFYYSRRKKSYIERRALLQRWSTQSSPKKPSLYTPMGLLRSHLAAAHYTGRSRDVASEIFAAKSVQSLTVGKLKSVYNSVDSIETFDGSAAHSSSQMSALFRRDLVPTRNGAFGFLGRNGSQR